MASGEVDDIQVEKSIGTLAAYAFVTKTTTEDSFDLHRLVSLSMRNWLQKEDVATAYATEVVMRLNSIFPAPDYVNKDIWLSYLPHTRHVLSSPVISKGIVAKAQLLGHVARAFLLWGNYRDSEQHQEQELELNKLLFGKEHPETLTSMGNLARVLDRQGKYEEAEKMLRQTLELEEKVLGKEHPDTLTCMHCLAYVLQNEEKYMESEQWYELALMLNEKVLGGDHPSTIRTTDNFAAMLRKQGARSQASDDVAFPLDKGR